MEAAETRRLVLAYVCARNLILTLTGAHTAPGNSPVLGKDGEELDQVAGNAEDEIGDKINAMRETELLYGPESLLALYGPMLVHICGSPHKFKVRAFPSTFGNDI
jgi:hypothetical protein